MTARPIRVLVVDDAVVVRRMLTDILGSDPEIEVAGTAPNGRVALSKIPLLRPDVVVLDVEMPELDGLETVRELRRTDDRLPVIMFSTLTSRGARATLDALLAGASHRPRLSRVARRRRPTKGRSSRPCSAPASSRSSVRSSRGTV